MARWFKLLVTSFSVAVLVAAPTVGAWDPFNRSCDTGDGSRGSIACETATKPNGDPLSGPASVIARVTDLMAVITGLAAVIAIIIAGIRFITASGDANSINSAKNTILYAIIGLAVVVAARTIIVYVIKRL